MINTKRLIVEDEEIIRQEKGVSVGNRGNQGGMTGNTTGEDRKKKKVNKPSRDLKSIQDVTDFVSLENELLPSTNNIETTNQINSEIISMMSHEFRTPLHSILGFCELLRTSAAGTLSSKQSDYLTYIKEGGFHLLDLVDSVLEFSKIDANKTEIKKNHLILGRCWKRLSQP